VKTKKAHFVKHGVALSHGTWNPRLQNANSWFLHVAKLGS